MELKRGILTVFVITIVAFLVFPPCSIAQDNSDQNQPSNRPRMGGMDRPGQRPGPALEERDGRGGPGERSGGRGGPGDRRGGGQRFGGRPSNRWRRPELTKEQIDGILEELKKRDPNTAKQLTELRTKEPEKFMTELRQAAGPAIIMRVWSEIRRKEFLEWLDQYVPKEAEELVQLKEKESDLYRQKYELTWRKWGRIYDQTKENPELAKVLVADFQLHERQRDLQEKYQAAKTDEDKEELRAQLEEVVSDIYDLTVRQKQMAYEQLLKRLEDLQNDVKASLKEIGIWKTEEYKKETVKKRMDFLTEMGKGRDFPWQ